MSEGASGPTDSDGPAPARSRGPRVDAQRNLDAILEAAKRVFATAGVEAPVRDIAQQAGVGIGTLYRHFPKRADLVAAVFRREIDACADQAARLAATHEPGDALALWMQRFAAFLVTKRGLASALYSGDPVFESLPAHFEARLMPALRGLLSAAETSGEIRRDVEPDELMNAVAGLCMQGKLEQAERMTTLLIDGLRYQPGAGR